MTLPTVESLRDLTRDELIAQVLQLAERLERLEAEVERLKRPPPTSRNSSQPPSRDQKPNAPARKRRRHRGAKAGHAKAARPLTDKPDQTIEAQPSACTRCGQDLQGVTPKRTVRRQITELPEIKPVVIETRQHDVPCPGCGHTERGRLPLGLEAERQFGPRLEATVTYLQHQQHLSYERTQAAMPDVFGVSLSEGGQACIVERAGVAAQGQADAWLDDIRQSAVVGSDETGARVDGRTWWEWVFVSATAVLHVIRPSRAVDVITEIMGPARVGTWISDCWKPQLRAPADRFQLCLAHQIRNLQGLRERAPRLNWARELQALFREAIHLDKRRALLSGRGFARRVTQIERRLDRLLARPVTTPAAQALVKRYRKHRAHLLVFLHDPAVPHHNNAAERALRPSVIHRKVTGGFRSAWGAHAYAALASVIDTAKLRGQSIFDTLVALMGRPVLPYLTAPGA
ncbi:MAG: IS66 family transposase [Anaerolineales bacterium]|nr:IS66 family transposase [Anaerolineales bacterium]